MKAINIMFDSLTKKYLSAYGNNWTKTPNFKRLAQKTVQFERAYTGSMPCMPARREMHTGRYNFLHRSWGPLEPFDHSLPELLMKKNIYSHCSTDHCHYWHDGGLTYLSRFSSYDMIRGQEGDWWKPQVEGFQHKWDIRRQDKVNRLYMDDEKKHPHVRTFESGMEFLRANKNSDNWLLQLEYFDPHEPFTAPKRFYEMYSLESDEHDWPKYASTQEQSIGIQRDARRHYAAALSMCDYYLGKVLDFLDEHNLWEDTMLIVNTDHGFLLGEHDFFGKNYMPTYQELCNIPLFIWDPRSKQKNQTRYSLVQTIDLMPTLLSYFGLDIPDEVMGKDLAEVIANDKSVREAALFGYFGKHVNVTDGRYVYMRSAQNSTNAPLYNYTLMPSHLFTPFSPEEIKLADETLVSNFRYAQNTPMLRVNANHDLFPNNSCYQFNQHLSWGDLCFDLQNDPQQLQPIQNEEVKTRMLSLMYQLMQEHESPDEQYERLGLPYIKV
ncbi:sulfatase [Vibrio mimicus]